MSKITELPPTIEYRPKAVWPLSQEMSTTPLSPKWNLPTRSAAPARHRQAPRISELGELSCEGASGATALGGLEAELGGTPDD